MSHIRFYYSNRSFDDRCDNVYKILDGVSSLKVVVLALADDLAALTLLDKIQV